MMPLDQLIAALDDREVLGLTAWAEARGDVDQETHSSLVERIAVMCAVRNRLPRASAFRADAPTYKAVCLAPSQFSCWSVAGGRDNYESVLAQAEQLVKAGEPGDPLLKETLFLADGIVSGVLLDVTGGSTMYYAPAAMSPPGAVPSWAKDRGDWRLIGSQRFFTV